MKSRSICFVNPTVLIKRPIAEIINKLEGFEIGLLCPKRIFKKVDGHLHYSGLIKKAKIYTYSTVTIPFISSEWPIPITPIFFIQLWRVFFKYNTIHIWTHFYITNFFVFLTKIIFPWRKLILTMDTIPGHSFSMGKIMDTLFKIYYLLFGWFIFNIQNKITLYGKSLVKYAIKVGVPKRKIKVLTTGIDLNKVKDQKNDIRKEFRINKKTIIVLFIGLIIPRKGINTIIDTTKKIKESNIKFILVGDGPDRKRYQQIVKKYKLQNKIIFTGWRKDVKNFYKSADIFFLPSKAEGLPGVVMEAMASGLPIVTTDIPCTTDLVKESKNGYLCRINDVNCFSERIDYLINKPDIRINMGKNSLKIIKDYDWKKIIKKYEAMYQ